MGHKSKSITGSRKGKHLTYKDRLAIEIMLKKKHKIKEIADFLDRSSRTIEREVARGNVEHLRSDLTRVNVYSSERGQDLHDLNATAKGPQLKLGYHHDTALFIRDLILEKKYAPAVVAAEMKKLDVPGSVCAKTLYSYIDQGLIKGVTNESLWEKRKRRKHRTRRTIRRFPKRGVRRTSIEKRPASVELREEFGHWEIDLMVGGKASGKPVLMTLVERKTRKTIIRKVKDKTQESIIREFKSMEREMGVAAFRCVFKSITADNGCEFLDVKQLERSAFSRKKRVKFYYAHPYASWERGSNENTNRMIRRFIEKGRDIAKLSSEFIKEVEEWINQYPRKILDWQTATECFQKEIAA